MSIRTLLKTVILEKPESFMRGLAAGLDDVTPGTFEDENIAWVVGYNVGELGPYAAIPVTAWIIGETWNLAALLGCI